MIARVSTPKTEAFEFFPAGFGSLVEVPSPTIEQTIVKHPEPAGGPDSGNCESKGD